MGGGKEKEDQIVKYGRRRMNAKFFGMVVAGLIILVILGVFAFNFIHGIPYNSSALHPGVYIVVERAQLINSSSTYSLYTTVKNAGTIPISSVSLSISGATVGSFSSIAPGASASGTFPLRGISGGGAYLIVYTATSTNGSVYQENYPLIT